MTLNQINLTPQNQASQLNQQLKQIQQIQGNMRMDGAQIPSQSLVQAIQALDAS